MILSALRLVSIGDYDTCTCCGTHVKNTSELQVFNIVPSSFERSRPGCVKFSFIAGFRVLKALKRAQQRDTEIGKMFSCAPDEFSSRISTAIVCLILLMFRCFIMFIRPDICKNLGCRHDENESCEKS